MWLETTRSWLFHIANVVVALRLSTQQEAGIGGFSKSACYFCPQCGGCGSRSRLYTLASARLEHLVLSYGPLPFSP